MKKTLEIFDGDNGFQSVGKFIVDEKNITLVYPDNSTRDYLNIKFKHQFIPCETPMVKVVRASK